MVVVHVPNGVPVQQVEGFPETVNLDETETVVVRGRKVERPKTRPFKRSRKGALYVRPRSTMGLTEDELAWLKQHHRALFARLRITADSALVQKSKQKAAGKKEERVEKPKPPEGSGGSSGEDGPSGDGGAPSPEPPKGAPKGSSKGSGKGGK